MLSPELQRVFDLPRVDNAFDYRLMLEEPIVTLPLNDYVMDAAELRLDELEARLRNEFSSLGI